MQQSGANKHSSKTTATPTWRKDRLQAKFDRLVGPAPSSAATTTLRKCAGCGGYATVDCQHQPAEKPCQ